VSAFATAATLLKFLPAAAWARIIAFDGPHALFLTPAETPEGEFREKRGLPRFPELVAPGGVLQRRPRLYVAYGV
jgi:hypothetical protein